MSKVLRTYPLETMAATRRDKFYKVLSRLGQPSAVFGQNARDQRKTHHSHVDALRTRSDFDTMEENQAGEATQAGQVLSLCRWSSEPLYNTFVLSCLDRTEW